MVCGRSELAEICDRLTGRASPRSSCPAATPRRSATTPTRSACSRTSPSSAALRPGRDHRLPRVPPHHQRRPDRAVDVGQAPARHPHRQQPDLRPEVDRDLGDAGCARAASRCRSCSACPARSTAPSCSPWPPRSASVSPRGSWPSTRAPSPASPPPAASPASASSSSARRRSAAPRALVEGLHVFTLQPDRRDRGLAQRADRAALTRTGSPRSSPAGRPRALRPRTTRAGALRGRPRGGGRRSRRPSAAGRAGRRRPRRGRAARRRVLGQPDHPRVVAEVVVAELGVAVEPELLAPRCGRRSAPGSR